MPEPTLRELRRLITKELEEKRDLYTARITKVEEKPTKMPHDFSMIEKYIGRIEAIGEAIAIIEKYL